MKKILTLVSAIALVFTSCSKDDNPVEESNAPILLTKMIETYEDGSTYTENFYYDGNKLIKIEDSDGESVTFVYDSNGKLVSGIEKYYKNNSLITGNINYVYNAQNKLSSIELHDNLHLDYTYNSNGTITEENYDSNGVADIFVYSFFNDNIVSINESLNGLPTYVISIQYDAKNNPFKNVYTPYELFKESFGYNFSLNNINNKIFNNNSNHYKSSTYTYIYNSDNFPTKRTETTGDGEVIITEYFYNN